MYCTVCRFDYSQGAGHHSCGGMPSYCGECGKAAHSGSCAYLAATALPPEMEERIAHLRSLKPGWDSYGGSPITEAAIAAAIKVVTSRGQLTPCSNGGVQIDWSDAEIAFTPEGEQDFDQPALDTIRTLQAQADDLNGELERHSTDRVNQRAELSRLRAEQLELTNDRDYRLAQKDAEVVGLRVENAGLLRSLENCRMLSAREIRRHEIGKSSTITTLAAWKHILRFCVEAGVIGSVLREELDAALNAGEAPREPSDILPAAAASPQHCEEPAR